MSKKALCKFVCVSTESTGVGSDGLMVTMEAITADYEGTAPEDQEFTKYTPSGNLSFCVENPALEGLFEAGAAYYIEIRRVEE